MGTRIYPISNDYTLRNVYLMWLIANDPDEFRRENDITLQEIISFRNNNRNTWGIWND
jgi:hypothetical protein